MFTFFGSIALSGTMNTIHHLPAARMSVAAARLCKYECASEDSRVLTKVVHQGVRPIIEAVTLDSSDNLTFSSLFKMKRDRTGGSPA